MYDNVVYVWQPYPRIDVDQDCHMRQREADRGGAHDRGRVIDDLKHCGPMKHDDRGCWKRLTFQKYGRKSRLFHKWLNVCAVCGEVHESGKSNMEFFFNLIRKCCVITKHAEMISPKVEGVIY